METASISHLTPAEIARKIAYIIDYEPQTFSMENWGTGPPSIDLRSRYPSDYDCETPVCIAGHIGAMHIVQQTGEADHYIDRHAHNHFYLNDDLPAADKWLNRQAQRLGLSNSAGQNLFCNKTYMEMTNRELSQIMQYLAKELETAQQPPARLIANHELERITAEALADLND